VELPGHEFLVPDNVRGEVKSTGEAQMVAEAVRDGRLQAVSLTSEQELSMFGALTSSRLLGVGECAALTLAVCRGLVIAVDDKEARRRAVAMYGFGRFVGTAELVVAAIRGGLIGVAEADAIKRCWQEQFRFRLGFGSFGEVV